MDTDIRDRLERSFGDGPAHPPLEEQLAAGSRALRRRRGTAAAAACAVVVALGASYAVATSGSSPGTGSQIAHEPTPSPSSAAPASGPTWEDDTPIRYLDGELQIRAGVVVHERLRNPFGNAPPKLSDALDLTYQGQRMWVLAERKATGFGYTSAVPSNGWASFADWVASQTGDAAPGEDGWPETVRLDAGGQVVAARGADIVQRTDHPRLGANFAAPGTPTGAAVVTVGGDDRSFFVVWRVVDGQLDVITTPPRDVVGASFDELLNHARLQYAAEEGLR
ncbi:hypothetical protein ASC77_16485 [Nocardioides sp. Root1257]|uniref:hypothetical protein n=1 Tax=unclassified Nocardioides TaxID=2615069 RepID=UPI00070027E7|nr:MULTISPECIES: hypothetical protein [unclassified Nocardioides]KQW47990.1 hypothetical protein ASC77_16485 [Nocardioides sp. Root1257]KRC45242.1 hypothetical protein ASE24_17435 [Nocardioides sp. Root224]